MISSISPGATPAASRASRAAATAKSTVLSSSAAKRRFLIPVRAVIHSSLVSINSAQSSLVITRSGT
jgi:hypothetical protein